MRNPNVLTLAPFSQPRIFVAIPKIAQQRINAAKLTIQGINLSQTQATNYTLSINSTIEADSSISATIDAFEGVMYLEDWAPQTPFARIQFPQTTSAAQTVVNITQFTEILDMNAFTVFNTWFLVNESINVSVEGDTQLKVAGLSKKYDVHFKKTVNMPALANFNGTTVPTSRVQLTADSQGDNFFGNVTIPNRSFITFEIVCSSPPPPLFLLLLVHLERPTPGYFSPDHSHLHLIRRVTPPSSTSSKAKTSALSTSTT